MTSKQRLPGIFWMALWLALVFAVTWGVLDLTAFAAGRSAAWALGVVILLAVVVSFFRQRRK